MGRQKERQIDGSTDRHPALHNLNDYIRICVCLSPSAGLYYAVYCVSDVKIRPLICYSITRSGILLALTEVCLHCCREPELIYSLDICSITHIWLLSYANTVQYIQHKSLCLRFLCSVYCIWYEFQMSFSLSPTVWILNLILIHHWERRNRYDVIDRTAKASSRPPPLLLLLWHHILFLSFCRLNSPDLTWSFLFWCFKSWRPPKSPVSRERERYFNIPNTPDITFVNGDRREVLILEISCSFVLYMEQAFLDELAKYQPLAECVRGLSYVCQLQMPLLEYPSILWLAVRSVSASSPPYERSAQNITFTFKSLF